MAKDRLHDAFRDALRDVYDAEKQIAKALPKLAKAATAPDLRALFKAHLEETKEHRDRLDRVFAGLEKKPKTNTCDGMAGILEEARAAAKEKVDDRAMDAWLVASARKVEHYEMAAYGTLIAWGEVLGYSDSVGLLKQTLVEVKAADRRLSTLAERRGANKRAAALSLAQRTDNR